MAYKVRFVNPQKQYADHKDEYLSAVDSVFSRGDLIMRGDLKSFEEQIANFCETKYAIGVNSGTSAIYLSLKAAGIGEGDEVITVAHTFIASISCVYLTGAKPILVDVGKDFNIDPNLIEAAITPKTKAIEVVHLNGHICEMDKILEIANKHNLIVIEDAAQAMGATLKMADGTIKKAGSFGLTGCFSLYPFKALGAFGNSGVITTNDPEMAKKLFLLRYNGEDRETRNFYYHSHNMLMDNLQAALINVKLKYFPSWLERRREIAKKYYDGLKDLKSVTLPNSQDPRFSDMFTNYVIRAERRDELKKYFDENELVETLISWPVPMYKMEAMLPNSIFLPETEKICKEVISLPMYPELTNEDVDFVIKSIKDFYNK